MYAAPPEIDARIFASLPEALRKRGEPNPLTRLLGIPLDSFLEGPSFDREGNLYCVDIAFGRIFRIDPSGTFAVVASYDGLPNGLKLHKDGRIFIADRANGLLLLDLASGAVSPRLGAVDLEPFRGLNDLIFGPSGDLFFTDQGMSDLKDRTGRVFRLRAGGQLDLLLDGLPGPNGIALDPTGTILYVALTRANSILRMLLMPDGCVSRVSTFLQLSGGGGPDGLAVDADGGLAVAHPQLGVVWRFDRRGQPTARINLHQGVLGTNIAYGGADLQQLFITESESATIQVADMPVPGLRLYSHA